MSKSKYGKETEEVWINPNSNYITGQVGDSASSSSTTSTNVYNTTNGMKASTTGNVTGIYDMSQGTSEYVAAYVNNGNENLNTYGLNLVGADGKYKDVYNKSINDDYDGDIYNYIESTPNKGKYGDAVYETSILGTSNNSWYSDLSLFPGAIVPFFNRGNYITSSIEPSGAGIFSFVYTSGENGNISFRLVLPVM